MACIDVWDLARASGGTPRRREENTLKNAFNRNIFTRNLQIIVRFSCSVNLISKFQWSAAKLRLTVTLCLMELLQLNDKCLYCTIYCFYGQVKAATTTLHKHPMEAVIINLLSVKKKNVLTGIGQDQVLVEKQNS